jgi:hypothetical protein
VNLLDMKRGNNVAIGLAQFKSFGGHENLFRAVSADNDRPGPIEADKGRKMPIRADRDWKRQHVPITCHSRELGSAAA